jgi:hypothetical protein
MRHLVNINPGGAPEIVYVPMREKYDCMTCVTAMLLGLKYEDVVAAFGGNIDPSKDHKEEAQRLYWEFEKLILKLQYGALNHLDMPVLKKGRRYWVRIIIDDPTQPLSREMGHGVVIDEGGRVFDPNPQYGQFKSFEGWQAAMSLPHKLDCATEIFKYSF